MVTQAVVLQQRLHGVGRAADVTGVHGLGRVQLLLATAGLVAVGGIRSLHTTAATTAASPSFQQDALKVGLFGGCDQRPLGSTSASARRPGPFGRLRQPVGRPVLTAAAAVAAAVEDAVFVPQVSLQQGDGVKGFTAEAAGELLAVRGDVALQLHLCCKRLAAKDALPALQSCDTQIALALAR